MADYAISFSDGTRFEVDNKPADLVRFERAYNVDASSIADSPRIEYVMFLAWAALKRKAATDLDFETFLDNVETIDPIEAAPLDPSDAS